MKNPLQVVIIAMLAMLLGACSVNEKQSTPVDTVAAPQALKYFEVYHDGRINIFDDASTYLGYLKLGETSYRLTRIGAGPGGQTIVFGLTKKDKKKRSGIKSVDLYDGKLKVKGPFYAEIVKHNRFYVYSNWSDLQSVKKVGEPSYFYTQIGAGPGGKTVIYVLNKKTKKNKPLKLIAQFRKVHQI